MRFIIAALVLSCAGAWGQVSNDPFSTPDVPAAEGRTEVDGVWMISEANQRTHMLHYINRRYFEYYVNSSTGEVTDSECGIFDLKDGVLRRKAIFATEAWSKHINGVATTTVALPEKGILRRGPREIWMLQDPRGADTLQNVADFSNAKSTMDGFWVGWVDKDTRFFRVYSRGRMIALNLNLKTRRIDAQNTGVFSVGDSGIIRERVIHSTENWKSGRGRIHVNETSFDRLGENLFRASIGRTQMYWVGELPKIIRRPSDMPKKPLAR